LGSFFRDVLSDLLSISSYFLETLSLFLGPFLEVVLLRLFQISSYFLETFYNSKEHILGSFFRGVFRGLVSNIIVLLRDFFAALSAFFI
jgi:hypothetical protein